MENFIFCTVLKEKYSEYEKSNFYKNNCFSQTFTELEQIRIYSNDFILR